MSKFGYSVLVAVLICQNYHVLAGVTKTRSIASVKVEPTDNNGYKLKINSVDENGEDYHLHVTKTESSIFSPNFKFLVLDVDEEGNQLIEDQTPSREELENAEKHLYVTSDKSQAVLNIQKDHASGHYRVTGYIDGKEISHHSEDKHFLVSSEQGPASHSERINDYVDLGRNIPDLEDIQNGNVPMTRQQATAQPEIAIVFDYANYQLFAGDSNNINYYLAVFYKAINNRYATFSKIVATITTVFNIKSRAAQPFMENNKIPDGSAYDMNAVLESFSYWVYANNASIGKFDLVPLISGENWKSKDSNGNYVSGIAGLAYVGGACWTSGTRYLGTSVNADQGGYWAGVLTAAHEMAHNLNSPHDGDGASSNCPWSQGYIMSYLGYGAKNKFYFSSCSQSLMNSFVASTGGACLKAWSASVIWGAVNENPGDRLDMNGQCQKSLNRTDAVVETANRSGNDMCLNLKCRVPNGSNGYLIYTMNRLPGDNSPCGTNMVCVNGDCVAKSSTGK